MFEELAILNRHQGFHQVRRHLIQLDQQAILVMRRVQATNQQWFQARHRQISAVGQLQRRDIIAGETHAHPLRRLRAFIELEATGVQLDLVTRHRYRTGTTGR